jgi:hypothetical protein
MLCTQVPIVQRISTEERAEDEARVRTVIAARMTTMRGLLTAIAAPGDGGAGADEADRARSEKPQIPGKPAGQELNRGRQTRAVGVVMEVKSAPIATLNRVAGAARSREGCPSRAATQATQAEAKIGVQGGPLVTSRAGRAHREESRHPGRRMRVPAGWG